MLTLLIFLVSAKTNLMKKIQMGPY